MDVILLEKVRNLGDLGTKVSVKAGYARNYLVPKGKAVPATAVNLKEFEARRAELEMAGAESLAMASARGEKLNGATLQILMKVGEEGKLFGSVGAPDIASAATEAGFDLAKAEILLPDGALKVVGDHEIKLSLHPEVAAHIIVSIVGEA